MVFVVLLASTQAQLNNLEEADAVKTSADLSNIVKTEGIDEEPTSKNERIDIKEVAIELTKKAGQASLKAAKKVLNRGIGGVMMAVVVGSFSLAVKARLYTACFSAVKAGVDELIKNEVTQEAMKMVAEEAASKAKKLAEEAKKTAKKAATKAKEVGEMAARKAKKFAKIAAVKAKKVAKKAKLVAKVAAKKAKKAANMAARKVRHVTKIVSKKAKKAAKKAKKIAKKAAKKAKKIAKQAAMEAKKIAKNAKKNCQTGCEEGKKDCQEY